MKARPILFSGPMVRALLEGRKTQTRRIAPVSAFEVRDIGDGCVSWTAKFVPPVRGTIAKHSGGRFTPEQASRIVASQFNRYGKPGDLLWVRETWLHADGSDGTPKAGRIIYRSNYAESDAPRTRWKSSIHMPRWASRLTLRITDVRVERLQDISEADAVAEGVFSGAAYPSSSMSDAEVLAWQPKAASGSAREAYQSLWESINGPGSWDANPWVWALRFEVIRKNVDEVMP